MTFTSMAQVKDAYPGQVIDVVKNISPSTANGSRGFSWWAGTGIPTGGANPPTSPGEVPTRNTVGSFAQQNAGVGKTLYLGRTWDPRVPGLGGTLVLYDRLYHMSGLVSNVAGTQNVDPTPTNPVNRGPGVGGIPGNLGEGAELWLENYATGSTGFTISATYTNSDGTSGQTTGTIGPFGSAIAGKTVFQFSLQTGDIGVRSVQSVTIGSPGTTAGNMGITIVRRVAEISQWGGGSNIFKNQSPFSHGLPQIYPDACLTFLMTNSASAGQITLVGRFELIQG